MENENIRELLEKLQAAKSAEELIELAKAEGVEIPADKSGKLWSQLNDIGEISDDEAEAAAGGLMIKRSEIPVEAQEMIGKIDREKLDDLLGALGQKNPESIPCSEEMLKQIKSKKWGY